MTSLRHDALLIGGACLLMVVLAGCPSAVVTLTEGARMACGIQAATNAAGVIAEQAGDAAAVKGLAKASEIAGVLCVW